MDKVPPLFGNPHLGFSFRGFGALGLLCRDFFECLDCFYLILRRPERWGGLRILSFAFQGLDTFWVQSACACDH